MKTGIRDQRSRIRGWLVLCLLASLGMVAHAQGGSISGQVITTFGYPAAGVPVRICSYTSTGNPCTPLSTIYADPTLLTPIGNPTTTDAYGNYSLFVPVGAYIVQITPSAGITYSYLVSSPGAASVYSVGLTMPSIFTVAGSPVTTGGVIGVTLTTESANLVFAGPSSGGAATPTFRSLVIGDLSFYSYSGNTTQLGTVSGSKIAGDGITFDASGNLITTGYVAGTATSVGITSSAAFLTIGSTPVTTSGNISLTFGATGSGADVVTASGSGTSGDCAQWSSGNLGSTASPCATVTSVGITSSAAFLSIGSTPVTTSGNISLTFTATGTGAKVVSGTGTYTNGDSVVIDINHNVVDSGYPAARNCGVNGCYAVGPDGTIHQWGTTASFGGSTSGNFTLNFPTSFTTPASIVWLSTPIGCGAGSPLSNCTGGGSSGNSYVCTAPTLNAASAQIYWFGPNTVTASAGACTWEAWGY